MINLLLNKQILASSDARFSHDMRNIVKLTLSLSIYLSISHYLSKIEIELTLYFYNHNHSATPPLHRKLFKHNWNCQLKPYSFPLRKSRVN